MCTYGGSIRISEQKTNWAVRAHATLNPREGIKGRDFELHRGGRQTQGDRKASIWQINVCWAIFNNGYREDFD